MSKYLYGPNGSKYVKVKHIPQENDSRGNNFFPKGDNFYYNRDGATYKMARRGGENWNDRLRTMKSSYNVELQRRRFRK